MRCKACNVLITGEDWELCSECALASLDDSFIKNSENIFDDGEIENISLDNEEDVEEILKVIKD